MCISKKQRDIETKKSPHKKSNLDRCRNRNRAFKSAVICILARYHISVEQTWWLAVCCNTDHCMGSEGAGQAVGSHFTSLISYHGSFQSKQTADKRAAARYC